MTNREKLLGVLTKLEEMITTKQVEAQKVGERFGLDLFAREIEYLDSMIATVIEIIGTYEGEPTEVAYLEVRLDQYQRGNNKLKRTRTKLTERVRELEERLRGVARND